MSAHLKAQALRFIRISALAFLTALPVDGGKVTWASLFALAAGAAEAALRQVLPVKPIPAVSAVLADAEEVVAPSQTPPADPAPGSGSGR